jgi:hypothetical protein
MWLCVHLSLGVGCRICYGSTMVADLVVGLLRVLGGWSSLDRLGYRKHLWLRCFPVVGRALPNPTPGGRVARAGTEYSNQSAKILNLGN